VITVSIVDSYPIFALGLTDCLATAADMKVELSAPSIEEYERRAMFTPDILIFGLESDLPGLAGMAAVEYLIEKGIPVLVTTLRPHPRIVVQAIAAGAKGILPKSVDPNDVPGVIRLLVAGERYVPGSLTSGVLQAAVEYRRVNLTAREEEVVRLLAMALTDSEIADELHISVRGVRSHLERIRTKTGRHRRADLTRLAFELGLVF
jgi:DNA-binding NarL/FixJ family response regulator